MADGWAVQSRRQTSYLFALDSLIVLMMEAARTSETSVDIWLTTQQYIPEDYELKYGKSSRKIVFNGIT
jgi:hypothetical protein